MAEMSPTAANIIASLGIRGVTDGTVPAERTAGFVPMLDSNGKLSVNFIPEGAAQMSVPPLFNVAVVDPNTEAANRDGSIAAPFNSLAEASGFGPDGGTVALLMMPGRYSTQSVSFTKASELYLIGLGECWLTESPFNLGLRGNSLLFLQNIYSSVGGRMNVTGASEITCLGHTHISYLSGAGALLRLSSETRVDSTDIEDIRFLSEDSRIKNTSEVRGATVKDAMNRVARRRIRVANISLGSSGIEVGSSSFIDISAESCSNGEVYDLTGHDRVYIDFLKSIPGAGRDIAADTVTAREVTAEVLKTGRMEMDTVVIGGYQLVVDAYGYLVVADGSDDPPTPAPPEGFILLKDSVTYTVYMIGVESGRLFMANAEQGSSSSPVYDYLKVVDAESGMEYNVEMVDGRLVMSGDGSSSGELLPSVYAVDEQTKLYHRIVAIREAETGEEVLGVYQDGERRSGIRFE